MAAPERNFSFNRDDERSMQPAYQPYQPSSHDHGDVSPVEGQHSFPASDNPPPPPAHQYGVAPATSLSSNYTDYSAPGSVAGSTTAVGGAEALRGIDNWGRNGHGIAGPGGSPTDGRPISSPFSDRHAAAAYGQPGMASANNSMNSLATPRASPPHTGYAPYSDNPYNRYSSSHLNVAPQMGEINPNDLADDDDWGDHTQQQQQKRRSFVPFGAAGAGAAAGAAGAGAVAGARDASGNYNAVPGAGGTTEKSAWLAKQSSRNKKLKWLVGVAIVLVVIGAIVGGILGSVLGNKGDGKKGNSAADNANNVASDNKQDLDLNSAEIKSLMNNAALHKVFPGFDYTPLNTQYPDCLTNPPSQNNVTRDMAVLSQLTNAVRLYGTDCNQTEMVLHAIDKLQLKSMKVWLGVWLGNNDTTNTRQLNQMYTILDTTDSSIFKGIIVGNEVLFRKDLTSTELLSVISDVKSNLTDKKIDLPVGSSDLGDNWTSDMATKVDIVGSNVHPFFAGVEVDQAAGWTWSFWSTHDVVLTSSDKNIQNIVTEVGWPSAGGNDCGSANCTSDTQGSIAGIDEMNQFMSDYICQSLNNGTEFFWFEAFDEPWKIVYDTPGKEWEDKWGIMDANRKLKDGVKIPDCGGKTVD